LEAEGPGVDDRAGFAGDPGGVDNPPTPVRRWATLARERVRRLMTDRVGVVRSAEGLGEAMGGLERLHLELRRLNVESPDPGPEGFEVANLGQLGRAGGAAERT